MKNSSLSNGLNQKIIKVASTTRTVITLKYVLLLAKNCVYVGILSCTVSRFDCTIDYSVLLTYIHLLQKQKKLHTHTPIECNACDY